MWTSVYMTRESEKARSICSELERNGIITMRKRICGSENPADKCYEILVPFAELEQALSIIIDV